jgi:hypothetical protein
MPGPLTSIAGAMNMGFPDVCLTMVGPAPAPIPYPNISVSTTSANPGMNMLLDFMPSVHQGTTHPMSNGDEPGASGGGGVVSHLIMGPTEYSTGLFNILIEGMAAQSLLSTTMQNGMAANCPGVTMTPTQFSAIGL